MHEYFFQNQFFWLHSYFHSSVLFNHPLYLFLWLAVQQEIRGWLTM